MEEEKKKKISKASLFFKQMMDVVMAIVKDKSLALKTNTTSIKTRLAVLGILRDKKSMIIPTAISHRIHALMGGSRQHHHGNKVVDDDIDDKSASVHSAGEPPLPQPPPPPEWDDDDRYPDLRHSLFFDMEEEEEDCIGSVIDLVRNGMEKEEGEFVLENEIDHVADVFIRRIHKQMRLQKQNSMKRYKEMLDRSV